MRSSFPSTRSFATACIAFAIGVALLMLMALAVLPGEAGAAVVTVRVSPASFSPNGDKVKDVVKASVKLTRRARLQVDVYDAKGKLVRTLQAWRFTRAGTRTLTWTGRRGGEPCGNGRFTIKARAKVQKKVYKASRAVTLDTLAPRATLAARGDDTVFAGAGAGQTFDYEIEGAAPSRLELRIFEVTDTGAEGGQVAAQVVASPAVSGSVTWDGEGAGGADLLSGRYMARIVATDAAGNTATSRPLDVGLFAPTDVTGTVKTNLGAPVAGALVTVQGADLTATTGADGTFTIAGCPMGFRVFAATKSGLADGSTRVEVNLNTGSADIVLGVTAAPRTASARAARSARTGNDVTISGHLYYSDEDGHDVPMRNVRVVLEDRVRVLFGPDWYRDFDTTTSGNDGFFTFTYNYEDWWDEWDEPDVRVLVYAQDGADDLCAVYDGFFSTSPYQFEATGDYTDNTSDRTDLYCVKTGSNRECWFLVDCMQRAHDRWKDITGFDPGRIWVDYPAEISPATGQFDISVYYTCINISSERPWDPAVAYHEYGHFEQYAGYDYPGFSPGCNVYWAYSSSVGSFFTSDGKYYGALDGDRETEWTEFKEGFAEFFAAVIRGWDHGAAYACMEAPWTNPMIQSGARVARTLWDAYDDGNTPLADTWDQGTATDPVSIPRPVGLYGTGDDDRLSQSGAGASGGAVNKIWSAFDFDWPTNMGDLRNDLIGRYDKSQFNQRGFDAALYYNGMLRNDISENLDQPSDVTVTGDQKADGSFRGTVRIWCDVTDSDVFSDDPDQSHIKVRLEYRYVAPGSGSIYWVPVAYTTAKAASPPTGETDTGRWYAVDWDTTQPSPVVLRPDEQIGNWTPVSDYGNLVSLKGIREDDVQVRLVACDDLKESAAVTVTLPGGGLPDIDNRDPAPAQADDADDYISWPTGYDEPAATYELWFKPVDLRYGTIASCSYQYGNYYGGVTSRSPTMRLVQVDDGVVFSLNENDGSGPDGGTWYTIGGGALDMNGWNHIAAQNGDEGMKLFINGQLIDTWMDYTNGPQADEDAGTLALGAFSLGDYASKMPQYETVIGRYKWLRVSDTQRYYGNFTPPETYTWDSTTVILDSLIEGTNGDSHGFIWVQ